MSRFARCLLFAAAIIPAARGAAQQLPAAQFTDPDRAAKLAAAYPAIDSLFAAMAAREHIPGAAWGIVIDGKLGHIGAAGVRDIATKSPVDTNSVFRIASMTKSFTAASILLLRDEGKLSLDDPAEKWIPELKGLRATKDSPTLTIRMLLSHDTGWPEDNPWGDQQLSIADSTLSRMIAHGIPFSHAPNTAYEYSNYAFMILGRIVSRASGMPYRQFVQTRLLTPLGMKSSTLEVAMVPKDKLTLGYRWEDGTWKLEPQLPDGAGGPMGGMLVSPHDMGVWIANMLSAWPPSDAPEAGPVKRSSLREMQQMHRTRPPQVTYDTLTKHVTLFAPGYGFGLRIVANCNFSHIVAHAGGLPGFGSLMIWLPEYGVGLFAFGNRTYTDYSAASDSVFALLKRTGGLERRTPVPAPALVRAQRPGVAPRDQVERRARGFTRVDESVPRPLEVAPHCAAGFPARESRRVHGRNELVRGGECAARTVDHAVRTRSHMGEHHDGADDAAVGAVPRCGGGIDGDGECGEAPGGTELQELNCDCREPIAGNRCA